MKFVIQKKGFQDVLARIQGLTGRKSNLAITHSVLIEALDDRVKLSATDSETGFEGEYAASVESPGTIAINAKKLYEIIREFPDLSVNIREVENRWIEIGKEEVEFHIVGMNPLDFPSIPKLEDLSFFEMPASVLNRMITGAIHILLPPDEGRAHFAGVYFNAVTDERGGNRLHMVSTDGSRLFLGDYGCEGLNPPLQKGVLIPKKGLQDANRFLDEEGMVQIAVKDNHFVMKKENECFTMLLLEGDFPTYRPLFNRDPVNNIVLDRNLFMMMLKRMSILSTEDFKGVIFTFAGDMLTIRTTNPEIGESKEEMGILFQREILETAFNPKFFIDALNLISDDNVVLNIFRADKPCLIRGENDPDFQTVIMPMKL